MKQPKRTKPDVIYQLYVRVSMKDLPEKIKKPEWKPDFGPSVFDEKRGATVIGARDFLVAYNVNLNTTSVRRANSVAFDVREAGRIKREGDPVYGEIVTDEKGQPVMVPGIT